VAKVGTSNPDRTISLEACSAKVEKKIKILTLSKFPSGAPDGNLLRVTIPDAVLIQFDLLRTSKILLETFK